MKTMEVSGWQIRHHEDYEGEVTLVSPQGCVLVVPARVLKAFAFEASRSYMVEQVERLEWDDGWKMGVVWMGRDSCRVMVGLPPKGDDDD